MRIAHQRCAATAVTRQRERGQAMLEFVFATLLALSIILGIMQIALVFNAHHMVQLAAFNAARAAIVTRNEDNNKPEEPTDLQEMNRKAKLAAFITLLPVIPDLHGALPTSLTSTPSAIQSLLGLNAADPSAGGGLAAFGEKALNILAEYGLFLSVKFVKADQDDSANALSSSDIQAMDPTHDHVEFDDRTQGDNNLIKVIVSWNYPLVIPFANRIFFAATNLGLGGGATSYGIIWLAAHPNYAASNPLLTARILSGDPGAVPVWGLGLEYETMINRLTGSNELAGRIARRALYRVPVKASYIMRMQWDRKP
jgi:hypothetical protein